MVHAVRSSADAFAAAKQFLASTPSNTPVWVVGGSSAAAADVVRLSCESALAGVARFDVRGLVRALSEPWMMRAGLSPLHRAPREVLLSLIAADTPLEYVGEVARFPGFARALGRTLDDLRTQRVGLTGVRNSGRSGPDVALLAERYAQELLQRRLVDYAARIDIAIAAVKELPGVPDLLVYATGPVARSEREFLDLLVSRSQRSLEIVIDAPVLPQQCDFLSASSEALEFVEIARRVLHSGVPFDRCALLLRNPSRQMPLALEAFERAGIPTWMEHGVRLPDRSGRGFLSLLRCRETDYGVAEFCDYLSLAALPHEAEQKLSQGQWESLLEQAAVVSGRDRWPARLDSLGERLFEQYQRCPTELLARRIDALESLRGFALPLIERLAQLPQEATWREWIDHFEQLAEYALADTRTIDGALDSLRPVSDVGGASFDAAIRTLETLVGEWQDEEGESRYGRVFVGSVEHARGLSFDLVCVPGLNEGLFPRPPREDPLLLDAQRSELQMPTHEDERALLDIAIAAAGKRTVFSWSNVDLATGRQRIHSFFAADLLAVTGQAPVPAESRIGWSAPADPMDSVDESEFDLSCLRLAWRGAGNMAWLAALNRHAARAIRARQQRWSKQWTEADGLHAEFDFDALPALQTYTLSERPWAPTSLNQFARCPYRFYLHGIAGLRERERAEPFACLDPRRRGQVYHQALQRFLNSEPDRTLEDCVEEVGAELLQRESPPVPGLWRLELRRVLTDLKTWLSLHGDTWSPLHVEFDFEDAVVEEGWKLKGTIDLVEQDDTGNIRIIDHKTGKPPFKKFRDLCIGNGEVLQPMLYALAWEALGRGEPQSTALSWGTTRGGFHFEHVPVHAGSKQSALFVLRSVQRALQDGFLPAAPRKDGCKGCEYLPVCGPYEEIRTAGKPMHKLFELKRIRGMK